jgi:formylglycine-generating enzyme required for sulfatase activity
MKKISFLMMLAFILIMYKVIFLPSSYKEFIVVEPKTIIREKDGMEMIYIPEGEFTMGSTFFESMVFANRRLFPFGDQRPQHKVYLDGYWIDKTEVTVGMFKKFIRETGYRTSAEKRGGGKPWKEGPKDQEWQVVEGIDWLHPREMNIESEDNHPVVQISWEDAMEYAKWAGAGLPTEAQWEKAARGTDGRKYPWGNEFNGKYLNYGDSLCPVKRWQNREFSDGYAFTSPVGNYPKGASPYGVLDMSGNVWEWVYDWYDED